MKRIYCILIANLIISSSYAQLKSVVKSHYIFPAFTQGAVIMKSGVKNEALLNYNTLTEEMVFKKADQKLAIPKGDMIYIDTVFIADRTFIVLDKQFVEILNDSKWHLYVVYKCKVQEKGQSSGFGGLSETAAINAHSSLITGGAFYELELPNNYKIEPYNFYWLKKNEELKKFVNMNTLKKLYKNKSASFKAYVKKNGVKYDNQEGIVQLIEYMEAN